MKNKLINFDVRNELRRDERFDKFGKDDRRKTTTRIRLDSSEKAKKIQSQQRVDKNLFLTKKIKLELVLQQTQIFSSQKVLQQIKFWMLMDARQV